MPEYYVNANEQDNGDHEVHQPGCEYFPAIHNAEYLGNFPSCHEAVQAARRLFAQVNGCYYCSRECHTQ